MASARRLAAEPLLLIAGVCFLLGGCEERPAGTAGAVSPDATASPPVAVAPAPRVDRSESARPYLQAALSEAAGINFAADRANVLWNIAALQRKSNDAEGSIQSLAQAKSAATSGKNDAFQHRTLRNIAEAEARMGNVALAKSTAEAIKDDESRAKALGAIAQAQAEAGDAEGSRQTFAQAKAIASGLEETASIGLPPRGDALASIAESEAKAGDFAGARTTAQSITDPDARSLALRSIARIQRRSRDSEGARRTLMDAKGSAHLIDDASKKSMTLSLIAEAQAKAGDGEGARETFIEAKTAIAAIKKASFGVWDFKGQALQFVASMEAQAGDVTEAMKTVDSITNERDKLSALSEIAKAQAKAGNVAGAKSIASSLQDARERGVLTPIVLDGTLRYIGIAQVKAGEISAAQATAAAIRDSGNKREVLERIAAAQAKSSDLAAAEATVAALSAGFDRCFGNLAIAKGLLGLTDDEAD